MNATELLPVVIFPLIVNLPLITYVIFCVRFVEIESVTSFGVLKIGCPVGKLSSGDHS